MNFPTEHRKILLRVLADTEILWTPHRWKSTAETAASAVGQRRASYPTAGVAVICSGGEPERKAHERVLADLEEAGCLKIFRGRSRRVGCCLTDAGDYFTRSIAPSGTLHRAWPFLRKLAKVADKFEGNFFVNEMDIDRRGNYRTEAGRLKLADLEEDFLPLICGRLVDSASDTQSRIGYRLTAAGCQALEGQRPPPVEAREYDKQLGDEFHDRFLAGLKSRADWKPSRPNLVSIPKGAGSWHEQSRVYA